ncbi:MAG TPA: hypothetical protein VLH36_04320, partial [Steroidobacteraceae bacterium]|nr:hypothetical protein [Steroidobacteraceae bacterium]
MDLPEIEPLACRRSTLEGPRINLLIPAVSERHVFGGIATALELFRQLSAAFPRARLVVLDETRARWAPHSFFANWPVVASGHGEAEAARCVVFCGARDRGELPVAPHDAFLATSWWSAYVGQRVREWQREQFGTVPAMGYFIQDFEPGFYPWSSRYALAESTYRRPDETIAVFNTRLLADYMHERGLRFSRRHVLEPRMNPAILAVRETLAPFRKQRRILVYGRPSVERNGFALLVRALRLWRERYARHAEWELVSAGETHAGVDLGGGVALRSVGKLTLTEYAAMIAGTAIGVSLMISPHPSYPPLEMAAFGCDVVTNGFANKDLSVLSPRIHSVSDLDAESVAAEIVRLCEAFDRRGESPVVQLDEAIVAGGFTEKDGAFPFCGELARQLGAGEARVRA